MIRALAILLAIAGCRGKSDKPDKEAPPNARPIEAHASTLVIEPAAAKLPGALWFVDDAEGNRRVIKLVGGKAGVIGRGADDVFGALYPTAQRLPDGRVIAIASHGDGRPDGERLVSITEGGSIASLGPPAMQLRDPAVSPDGTWVVAAVQTDGITNLVRIHTATGDASPLTSNREGNFYPVALSTEAIAFVSSRDGDSEIYRMNIDGSKVQRLTAFHREDWEPAIDVSGSQLAFTSDREQKVPRIFVVKPDGTGVHRLTKSTDANVQEGTMVWSPKTPAAYAYSLERAGHTQIIAALGGVEKVLTPPSTNDAEVAFSPDGSWLVLVRERGGDRELVAYPLPAGSGEPIVVARGAIRTPRWF